jgi:hypothetical protein
MKENIMIVAYFQCNNSHTEEVARFIDNEVYMACLPALEKLAEESRMFLWETERDHTQDLTIDLDAEEDVPDE